MLVIAWKELAPRGSAGLKCCLHL